jgi:N-acylneuraminate cytidylyltransferase
MNMTRSTGKALAIIPARGGSKGIPRKNIRLVCGQPLIAWTIQAARTARSVGRVVVSTDDSEIADVASRFGAEVVRRPAELSGDTASSEQALLHTLEMLEADGADRPPLLAFLQCTSPLTLAEDVDGTLRELVESNADSALTVAPFHHFLWRAEDGNAVGANHDKQVRPMRQARKPQYLETGAVYAMKTDGFRAARHRFFGKTVMHVVPSDRTLEIDDPRDLVMAETLLRIRTERDRENLLPTLPAAVVFDFDGVFTDNGVWLDEDGREAVVCRRDDGMGIQQLKRIGVPILVLSTERNPVVSARARKLGIECIQGCDDKEAALLKWLVERNLAPDRVVYVGNDVNDLDCLRAVGCGVAVADAYPEAQRAARIVLSRAGGRGAVRELCDLITQRAEAA